MPLSFRLDLLPTPDTEIVEAIRSVAGDLPPNISQLTFEWRVFDNESSSVPLADIASNANLNSILEQRGEVLRCCALVFRVPGQPQQAPGNLAVDRQQDGSLTVNAQFPDAWSGNPDAKTKAAIAVRMAFTRYAKSKVLEALAPTVSDFYTRRESTLIQLEALNAQITVENDRHRRELEQHLDEGRQRLDESYAARLQALEAEYRARADALAKREADLDERKKLLDDRDNTHARRQIQQDVKAILKERNTDFSLTPRTIRKRWPATAAFVALMLAFAVGSAWAFWASTRPLGVGQPFWYPVLRIAVSLSALASVVVFYIRWQDRWSEAHAIEEFRLKRFDLDISRASWLVEVMLEWSSANAEFPKELIEKLATGLFEQVSAGPLVRHPAEEILGALLSSPAAVNLKFPGGDVSLDRKGVKEMGRKAD
jgi:hypothetical protein